MSIPDAKSSKSPGSCNLSEDAILEILLKLPVKILVQFKCVCKQLYTIIESQSFVEQHSHQRQERLLFRHYKPNEDANAYALFVDDTCSGFEEPALLQMPNMIFEILGPVNGVFCLVGRLGDLALLNPATRQLKPLPELPEEIFEPHIYFSRNVVGFGLDPSSGDYNVVSLWNFLDKHADNCDPIVFVYNLGCDSWRKLKDVCRFKSGYPSRSLCRTYLNGVYYWIMLYCHDDVSAVLAFDMVTEKFQEMVVYRN